MLTAVEIGRATESPNLVAFHPPTNLSSAECDECIVLAAAKACHLPAGAVRMSEVKELDIDWLWYERIPRGMITLLEGDPDEGKSTLTSEIAGHVTVGRAFFDGSVCPVGGAVILSGEEDKARMTAPRLRAAGANLRNVTWVSPTMAKCGDRPLVLPEDIGQIEKCITAFTVVLFIDPLNSFMGKLNPNSDTDVRRALAPLKELAERKNIAVIVLRHLNKDKSRATRYIAAAAVSRSPHWRASRCLWPATKTTPTQIRCAGWRR
jgi:RecA-family ATPase